MRFTFSVTKLTALFLGFSSFSNAENQDVLLITSTSLAPSWKPFVQWKKKLGKRVKVISINQIFEQYHGKDIQEGIRLCVRDHVDNHNSKWIVLGGDSLPDGKGIVPDRDTQHNTMWGSDTDIPTDIYYISPTNWDADNDGIYGEFEDDKANITYPDGTIGLGRIPVRTKQEVADYIAKVISYESKYPKGNFGNTITYTCSVPSAYPKVNRSWDDHVSKVMKDAELNRYYLNSTPWDDKASGDFTLSPSNLIKVFNRNESGKFHIHGHGFLHCWVLENNEIFTYKHVKQLRNKDAYPIITTVSCFTGHYDSENDPSISEYMLRIPDAGAIAVVTPCRIGKPHFLNPKKDFQLMLKEGKIDGTTTTMTLFWEEGIGNNLTTGEALMQTKAQLAKKARLSANFHLCLAEINLLGDPTIMVQSK